MTTGRINQVTDLLVESEGGLRLTPKEEKEIEPLALFRCFFLKYIHMYSFEAPLTNQKVEA